MTRSDEDVRGMHQMLEGRFKKEEGRSDDTR